MKPRDVLGFCFLFSSPLFSPEDSVYFKGSRSIYSCPGRKDLYAETRVSWLHDPDPFPGRCSPPYRWMPEQPAWSVANPTVQQGLVPRFLYLTENLSSTEEGPGAFWRNPLAAVSHVSLQCNPAGALWTAGRALDGGPFSWVSLIPKTKFIFTA